MMDCNAYRRSVMADPRNADPQLREHRRSCHDCNLFTERLLNFESRLDRALHVAVPADNVVPLLAKATPALRLPNRRGWLAMAASVLMAVVVAGVLWVAGPGSSLAADVVTHMGGEPDAWHTHAPVPDSELEGVLRDSHLRLSEGAGPVSYAASCAFRGHHVPHLVIQTESGPVTVMVLVHENVPKPVRFEEGGYRGVIVPVAGHGSLAVLTRGSSTDIKSVEAIAARVQGSITWTGT
jgi:Protein of unknown function (DUF3379)